MIILKVLGLIAAGILICVAFMCALVIWMMGTKKDE